MLRKSLARESGDMKYSWSSLTCYVTLPFETFLVLCIKRKEETRENKKWFLGIFLEICRYIPSWVCVKIWIQMKSSRGALQIRKNLESNLTKRVERKWRHSLEQRKCWIWLSEANQCGRTYRHMVPMPELLLPVPLKQRIGWLSHSLVFLCHQV